jgi:hypothetical protein
MVCIYIDISCVAGNTTRTNESGIADAAVIVSRTVPSTLLLVPGKVRENGTFCLYQCIMIILPRQARDKHRENSKKNPVFSQVEYFIAAVTTTVAMPAGYDPVAAATAEYTAAEANASSLFSTHVSAWQTIWQDGGEFSRDYRSYLSFSRISL